MVRTRTRISVGDEADVESEITAPREAAHTPRGASARMPEHLDEHDAPRVRTRRRKATVNEDIYYIPLDEIPEGLSYEWKRWSVSGLEDPFYIAQMREQGWEPVPPKRHPNWVPPGYKEPHIIKGGMILMDRPMELTKEARAELKQLAKQQVREAEQRLGKTDDGTLQRTKPSLVKEMMRPIMVED